MYTVLRRSSGHGGLVGPTCDYNDNMELFEARRTELPSESDAANLDFVRKVMGEKKVASGAVISRTRNSYSLDSGFRTLPVSDLG